jgi:phage terminase small subunit
MPRTKFKNYKISISKKDQKRAVDNLINPETGMTRRMELFCNEFIKDFKLGPAVRRAGYDVNSDSSASSHGIWLMKNPKIIKVIKQKLLQRMIRTQIDQDKVVHELANIAFFNPADVIDDNNNFIPIKELDRSDQVAIKEIRIKQLYPSGKTQPGETKEPIGQSVSIKFHDKMQALEMLGRHVGMYDQKFKIDVNENKRLELKVSWQDLMTKSSDEELAVLESVLSKMQNGNIIDVGNASNSRLPAPID